MVLAMSENSKENYDNAFKQALFLKEHGYMPELPILELVEVLLKKEPIPEFGYNWMKQ